MQRSVIDTNIIVSGLRNNSGPPAMILRLIYDRAMTAIVTDDILVEYKRVIHYEKFNFSPSDKSDAIEVFSRFIIKGSGIQTPIFGVPDDDLKFVHAALQYNADFLITGNIKHFKSVSDIIRVITPAEFIKRYEAKS